MAMGLAVACGGDDGNDAADAAKDAGNSAGSAATDMMNKADAAANDAASAAESAADALAGAAGSAAAQVGSDAATICRKLAATNSWSQALEACQKAHEMLPDDLEIEHAYQQAKAAAAN